jgi:hypothetical protein
MINRRICMELILETDPGFIDDWDSHLEEWKDWKGLPITACSDLSAFADYIDSQITSNQMIPLEPIFNLIEKLMIEGDEEVRTAVATCFLESLQNMNTPQDIWVPLLGPQSREYCKAWDDFTGVQTEGL